MLSCLPYENVGDVHESGTAEDEVSPLVAGRDEGSNKTSNDHDLVDKDHEENAWPWHGGSQHQIGEEERCSDNPDTR